ncbi:MAG: hypothetical protein ACSW8C_03940, partial [bacterium]
ALEALEGETDSDRAHTLITQLEIDEKFIYEEFQALRTHYKYNADTKQWDEMIDEGFETQLEEFDPLLDEIYGIDAEGNLVYGKTGILIDAEGKKIAKNGENYYTLNVDGTLSNTTSKPVQLKQAFAPGGTADGKYYVVSNDGKSLTGEESTPVMAYLKNANGKFIDMDDNEIADAKDSDIAFRSDGPDGPGYYYGDREVNTTPCFFFVYTDENGNRLALFSDCEGDADNKWYILDDEGKPSQKTSAPNPPLSNPVRMDEEGDIVNEFGYKLDKQGNPTTIPGKPVYQRDENAFLLNSEGEKLMKADGSWYQLDADGKLTMVKSLPYLTLQALRDTKIAYKDSTSETGERKDKPLTVFNSVTLLDRLRYIRYYYKLILQIGATDYSVFPNSAETGYPCLPNVESTEATKDTKNLGALEVFYVGYLIDRDGPINAVSSFFEVKTAALRNNLTLQSQKITALNIYLDFINRGMDVLNQSQANGKKRVPDGAHNALTYLCGEKMYNLFEKGGVKYLVVPCTEKSYEPNKGNFRLIRADDSGKAFLLGTNGDVNSAKASICVNSHKKDNVTIIDKIEMYDECNAILKIPEGQRDPYKANIVETKQKYVAPSQAVIDGKEKIFAYYTEENGDAAYKIVDDFVLPTQLEVSTIIPGSVKGYLDFSDPGDDQKHTAMIESWTNALSNKTQYINTAIDTINTDVSVDRSKIDTFDSLTSTFRSRAQDVYLNTAANIRG